MITIRNRMNGTKLFLRYQFKMCCFDLSPNINLNYLNYLNKIIRFTINYLI